jgi:hypothetical protein
MPQLSSPSPPAPPRADRRAATLFVLLPRGDDSPDERPATPPVATWTPRMFAIQHGGLARRERA